MSDYVAGAMDQATKNENFRKVLQTSDRSQTVAMSLQPKEDIGMETHDDNEQLFIVLDGQGLAEVGGAEELLKPGDLLTIRPGVLHNITNTVDKPLKLLTIYVPAHHPDGTVHATKHEAELAEHS